MEKQHMKFSTLNVDFGDSSVDFLGSRKPAHKGIKEWYPVEVATKLLEIADSLRTGTAIGFRASREH